MKNIVLILLIGLLGSLVVNFIQYKTCNKEPVIERDTVTVTVIERDTVYKYVSNYYTVEKPVPVMVHDTLWRIAGVNEYRDTLQHEFGKIYRAEWVKGELLKKDLLLDLKLPEITNTVTTTQTITNTVRNPLLFFTAGMRTGYPDKPAVPGIGLFGVSEGHRWSAGVEYGWDRQLTMKVGFALKR
jgi:hypothetical protein